MKGERKIRGKSKRNLRKGRKEKGKEKGSEGGRERSLSFPRRLWNVAYNSAPSRLPLGWPWMQSSSEDGSSRKCPSEHWVWGGDFTYLEHCILSSYGKLSIVILNWAVISTEDCIFYKMQSSNRILLSIFSRRLVATKKFTLFDHQGMLWALGRDRGRIGS